MEKELAIELCVCAYHVTMTYETAVREEIPCECELRKERMKDRYAVATFTSE